MATLYSDIATLQNASLNTPSSMPNAGNFTGRVCMAEVKYTIVGTEAINDVIYLVDIPSGGRVLPGLCSLMVSLDVGTTLTGHFGHTTDPDAYAVTATLGALVAGTPSPMILGTGAATVGAEVMTPVRKTGRQTVTFTISAATSGLAAGAIIKFFIAYVMPN